MAKKLTEDEVRDGAKLTLGFHEKEKNVKQGTGQLTTFNQLGLKGVPDKPDGWYLPDNKNSTAIILECKNSDEDINDDRWKGELKKNCEIVMDAGWEKVIGLLYNGHETKGYYNNETLEVPDDLQHKSFYIKMIND